MRKRIAPAPVPPERELAKAWQAAAGAGALTTTDGASVRVVYPGRRNPAAGPDFLDAVLATAAGEVRGAVEVHRRTCAAGKLAAPAGRRGGTQLPRLELGAPGRATASRGGAAAPLFPCAAAIL